MTLTSSGISETNRDKSGLIWTVFRRILNPERQNCPTLPKFSPQASLRRRDILKALAGWREEECSDVETDPTLLRHVRAL